MCAQWSWVGVITISTFIVYIDMEVCVSRKHIMHPTHGISKIYGQKGSKISNTVVIFKRESVLHLEFLKSRLDSPVQKLYHNLFVYVGWNKKKTKNSPKQSVPASLWAYKRICVPSGWKHYARCKLLFFVPFLECALFGMCHFGMCSFWNAPFLEYAGFGMFLFWICPFRNVSLSECAFLGMCSFWNVSFSECVLFSTCLFWNVLFLECALFGMYSLECALFRMCCFFEMCLFQNVLYLECALFRIWLFWMCPFQNLIFPNVLFLECAVFGKCLFGICSFWNVPFSECALFGMYYFWNVPFLEYTFFGMCSFGHVPFLARAFFGMCPFGNVPLSEFGLYSIWNLQVIQHIHDVLSDHCLTIAAKIALLLNPNPI